jgi:hypothetical protein
MTTQADYALLAAGSYWDIRFQNSGDANKRGQF